MRKSFLFALAPLVITAMTACSAQGGAGQRAETVALAEESKDEDADTDEKGVKENSHEQETGDSAADNNIIVITSMNGEEPSNNTVRSGTEGVQLSLKDGLLYLDEEVLAVQGVLGQTASGKSNFVVKVKPGLLESYNHDKFHAPDTSDFYISYKNQEGSVVAKLNLSIHYMTAEDFRLNNEDDNLITTSDGTLMTTNEYTVNGTSKGITDVLIFDPDLGGIKVYFTAVGDSELYKTGDEVMEMLKPHLEDFKSRFEVVSEEDYKNPLPTCYVQMDSDYFSYNVDNTDKLDLEFSASTYLSYRGASITSIEWKSGGRSLEIKISPEAGGYNYNTKTEEQSMIYKKLYDDYGKGLFVRVEPEGNGTYSYDSDALLLLTSNGAFNADTYNEDGGGFTKEEIESGLNFVFGNEALVLK